MRGKLLRQCLGNFSTESGHSAALCIHKGIVTVIGHGFLDDGAAHEQRFIPLRTDDHPGYVQGGIFPKAAVELADIQGKANIRLEIAFPGAGRHPFPGGGNQGRAG